LSSGSASSSNSSSISLASARDSEFAPATTISLMASSYSFILVVIVYIPVATLTWIALLCSTAWHSCINGRKVRTAVLTVKEIQIVHWQCSGKLVPFKSPRSFYWRWRLYVAH
jgi:hypothetical protein